jgi:hypothetical protein
VSAEKNSEEDTQGRNAYITVFVDNFELLVECITKGSLVLVPWDGGDAWGRPVATGARLPLL